MPVNQQVLKEHLATSACQQHVSCTQEAVSVLIWKAAHLESLQEESKTSETDVVMTFG